MPRSRTKRTNKKDNSNLVLLVIVGVLVGWLVGFVLGSTIAEQEKELTYDQQDSENVTEEVTEKMPTMAHETTEVDPVYAPTLKISAVKDSKSGYNINLATTNFRFSPENAGKEHIDGQGHAHIYLNGEKIGRVYSSWVHVDNLVEGKNTIKVTLNGNDHNDLAVDGNVIEDSVFIEYDGHDDHAHVDGEDDHSH